jgi:hypothetical protein
MKRNISYPDELQSIALIKNIIARIAQIIYNQKKLKIACEWVKAGAK